MQESLRRAAANATTFLSRAVANRVLETLFPARCAGCRCVVGGQGALCAACWNAIHFIARPVCVKCGLPFEFAIGHLAWCGACLAAPPPYTAARSVFRYDEHSKSALLSFKYADRTQLAPLFAGWLARLSVEWEGKIDAILPVPLHRRKLLSRRYNQAALLAQALARLRHLPYFPDHLRRVRPTLPQAGLTRPQREANVRRAFRAAPAHAADINGKSLLLIDDVMTTGATLHACARALTDAGARDVYVLTLARTVAGQ